MFVIFFFSFECVCGFIYDEFFFSLQRPYGKSICYTLFEMKFFDLFCTIAKSGDGNDGDGSLQYDDHITETDTL